MTAATGACGGRRGGEVARRRCPERAPGARPGITLAGRADRMPCGGWQGGGCLPMAGGGGGRPVCPIGCRAAALGVPAAEIPGPWPSPHGCKPCRGTLPCPARPPPPACKPRGRPARSLRAALRQLDPARLDGRPSLGAASSAPCWTPPAPSPGRRPAAWPVRRHAIHAQGRRSYPPRPGRARAPPFAPAPMPPTLARPRQPAGAGPSAAVRTP